MASLFAQMEITKSMLQNVFEVYSVYLRKKMKGKLKRFLFKLDLSIKLSEIIHNPSFRILKQQQKLDSLEYDLALAMLLIVSISKK